MPETETFSHKYDKNGMLLKITCLFWLLAKVLCWRIWTTDRLLPTAPLFEFFDHIPVVTHTILFTLSILLLLLLFFRNNKYLIITLIIVEIFSCLLDQNRIAPWEYMYLFILLVYVININNPEIIPASIGLILFSTYLYASICKFNQGYLHIVWDDMILRHFLKIPVSFIAQKWVHYSGYLATGIFELLPGIGLLFAKTQLRSSLVLIVMHLFILLIFNPFGFIGYRILWPWNISMILLLYYVFIHKNEGTRIFPLVTTGWNKLVLICWIILPAFSFWGYWDKNLSSNLFSANVPKMIICVTDTSKCKPLQRFCSKGDVVNTCHGLAKIDIQTWAIGETGVPAYLEIRAYKIMQKKLEKQYAAAGLNFVYLPR
jgi:hypothetical protein